MEDVSKTNTEDKLKFEFFSELEKQETKFLKKHLSTRISGTEPFIKTTEYFVDYEKPAGTFPDKTIVYPNSFRRVFFIGWSCMVIFIIIDRLSHLHTSISLSKILFIVLLVCFILVNLIPRNFKHYIILDWEGITIEGKRYLWSSILETYIVRRPEKGNHVFLVLGFRNGELIRFPLERYEDFFPRKIDRLVVAMEYYKHENRLLKIEA